MSYALDMKPTKKPQTVAEFFKALRVSREITQAQLAAMAGTSKIYIGHIEQGLYARPMETIKNIYGMLNREEKEELKAILVKSLVDELEG